MIYYIYEWWSLNSKLIKGLITFDGKTALNSCTFIFGITFIVHPSIASVGWLVSAPAVNQLELISKEWSSPGLQVGLGKMSEVMANLAPQVSSIAS